MASVSSDGLSNESMKKRLSEHGCLSYVGVIPKYKVRKVSALRDFPPECGKIVTKSDLNHEQNPMVSTSEDGVNSNIKTESRSIDVLDSLVNLEEQDKLDRLIGEVVATSMRAISNGMEEKISDDKSPGFVLPKVENGEVDLPKEKKDIQSDTSVNGIDDERTLPLVESVGGEHKTSMIEIESVTDEPTPVSEVKISSPLHTSFSPKHKYCKRKVSAARDFPPFCGAGALEQTEEICFNVTEESRDVAGLDKKDEVINTQRDVMVMDNGALLENLIESEAADSLGERDISIVKDRVLHDEEQEGVQDDYDGKNQVEKTVLVPEIMMKKEDDAGVVGKEIVESEKITSTSSVIVSGNEMVMPLRQVPCPRKKKSLDDPVTRNKKVASQVKSNRTEITVGASGSEHEIVKPVVQCLMAEPYCPWMQEKKPSLDCRNQVEKSNLPWRKKKAVAKKSNPSVKKKSASDGKATNGVSTAVIVVDDDQVSEDSPVGQGQREFGVSLPPFGPNSSSHGDARSKVRETLRLFQALCRKLLQEEESQSRPDEAKTSRQANRIDLNAAKIIKEKGKEVNTGQHIVGAVPGVEVGDEFQYRVELAIVGVHRLYQAGIDYMKQGNMLIAISIVSSGAYDDAVEDGDVLIYSGQGGNVVGKKTKIPEDQKLERGNLALKNSIAVRNPVRVVRGSKETKTSESSGDGKGKVVTTYVYDGLYNVDNYWTEQGPKGGMVFMFKLVRISGQPELAWKEVKSSKKSRVRHGVCVHDLTEGKETVPISAVNTIDGEKPPPFSYIKNMIFPDWFHPSPPKGCDCIGRCADSKKCSCAVKNGGEIPYNRNGAIVEVKPLVYECGPHCKCPPSCYNRVSQHGVKIPLEIFKTSSRGWGVRALTSIPSGTFICEYVGELLEEKEAERRIGNDEYLFDIGQNYSDWSSGKSETGEEGGYTIDAAEHGNVGRFINHSCSPNLYAQNVLYDYEDKKIPHIMLFAADNIPPLTELTYHYNYSVDQVYDSNGNVKVKKCFCGASECSGRMY